MLKLVAGVIWISFVVVACVTPGEKERINADLFDIKTKLLTLEGQMKGQNFQAESQGQTLATSHSRMDKLEFSMQKMKGDIEALRIGVITGEMPGVADSEQKDSVAQTLADLTDRLEKIESNQQALMAALNKKSSRKANKSSSTKARTSLSSLGEIEAAFGKKHYKKVAREAPDLIGNLKGKEKSQAMYLLAESLYKLGRLRDAALKFNDFIESKPVKYLAHAKMRMGDCFRHLGEKTTAKIYYEELLTQFPSTAEAKKAKDRLDRL